MGHNCKKPHNLCCSLMDPIWTLACQVLFVDEDFLVKESQGLELQEQSSISYHDLSGGISPSTFTGKVNGSPVQVLVDGGRWRKYSQFCATTCSLTSPAQS